MSLGNLGRVISFDVYVSGGFYCNHICSLLHFAVLLISLIFLFLIGGSHVNTYQRVLMEGHGIGEHQMLEDPLMENHFALGKLMSTKLTPLLAGDVLESWNFLWRFREVLGLRKGFLLEHLIKELNGSLFDGLSEAHILMLQVLISEFSRKMKLVRKRIVHNMPCLNDLTWPELARRYILAMLCMTEDPNSEEGCETMDIFRCLYGDGGPKCGVLTGIIGLGPKCGVLTGIIGLEADTLVFAASTNKIYGSLLYVDTDKLAVDELDSDEKNTLQSPVLNEGIPGWVQELGPVKNLKTNVGSRIRKCIYNSLEKEPPAWAREILERSVSKEVYKANASGPTKKLALHVVAEFHIMQPNLTRPRNNKNFISISDIVMKHCRIMLRRAAASEKTKRFCNFLGMNLAECGNNKEGVLGSSAVVSSLLYFRMIDMRLAVGAYCGSHEAFIEDVQEFWRDVQIDFGNFPALVKFAMEASHVFESLCVKEVVALDKKLKRYRHLESLSADHLNDIQNIVICANEITKAPWDEGVCRVCGIDQDSRKVLLCDECDAEYHTYCLTPPLARVPGGNWFCPCCIANKGAQNASLTETLVCAKQKKKNGEFVSLVLSKYADLEAMVRGKEYWELNLHERTCLLKFLCNEMLDSTVLRKHLTKCESREQPTSIDLQSSKEIEGDSVGIEFLGIDFDSKLYWKIDFGTNPWIVVNCINESNQSSLVSKELSEKSTLKGVEYLSSAKGSEMYSFWDCCQSHAEIKRIAGCLKDNDPVKERLMGLILLHDKLGSDVPNDFKGQGQKQDRPFLEQGQKFLGLESLKAKATKVLELKCGPFVEVETTDLYKKRNKGKEVEAYLCRCECLEPVLPTGYHCPSCHKTCFTSREHKLHGNGICNIKSMGISIFSTGKRTTNSVASKGKEKITGDDHGPLNSSINRATEVDERRRSDLREGFEIGKFFNVPVSSVRPLMGKASEVLTQLKINLLDMEAAIPSDALKPSRATIDRRWAWRSFVKHASTIYEMVQALIVFEDMIKREYLGGTWRYWTSFSAPVKISTLSALSLRIYSLDDAINYEKTSCAASSPHELLAKADSGKGLSNIGPDGKPCKKKKRETVETS